jgi:hypothetical protein
MYLITNQLVTNYEEVIFTFLIFHLLLSNFLTARECTNVVKQSVVNFKDLQEEA